MIKVWNYDQLLLTEIVLDDTLSECVFFNSTGDLLVGWKKHLFVINHQIIASHTDCMPSQTLDICDCGMLVKSLCLSDK